MQIENKRTDTFELIPLSAITASLTNPRRDFPPEGIASLADSIRQHGVLQPILVRPTTAHATDDAMTYEIVAGERRFRAAQLTEQPSIPARIFEISDEETLQIQLVENLQREDVHPLDEAHGFRHLQEAAQLDVADIAQRVAKDVRYVTRRLALTRLIREAQIDFRKDAITLAHVLEICRLSPEIQHAALVAWYERKSVWNRRKQTWTYLPDKSKPAKHVRYLQEWLLQNVHLNLTQAPFTMDDTRLRKDKLTCLECPQRTGHNKGLFADIENDATCLSPPCFKGKVQTLVQIRKTELDRKRDTPAAYITPHYDTRVEGKEVLTRAEYQPLERKAERCSHAEQAVYVDGAEVAQVKWICREATCKDHLGRVRESYASSSSSATSTASVSSPADRNKRKQELFDIKIDEIVRKRVMAEAVATYKFPFERRHLNQVAGELFRRIPSDDQRTILEVFGWNDKDAANLRLSGEEVLSELAKLDDQRLAQLMMLCSFAHFGANPYKSNHVNQQPVVKLSEERGVNHTLIDAQVRLELAPKKYKARHQTYLDAVTKGAAPKRPVVYEQPSQKERAPQHPHEQAEAA